jgi:polysaccharide export outer membrane protein
VAAVLVSVWVLALPPGLPGQDAPSEYRLTAGDVINITVFGHPEFSGQGLKLGPDGRVTHPFLGSLYVQGKTLTEVAVLVTEGLRTELREPRVAVQGVALGEKETIRVLGAVTVPGPVEAQGAVSIRKAIALAGGLTPEANHQAGTLIPRQGPPRAVPLPQEGSLEEGPELQLGDALLISVEDRTARVLGEVGQPGGIMLPPEGLGVAEAIAEAGGLTQDADQQKALIVREDGTSEPVDLAAVIAFDPSARALALKPGDLLVIQHVDRYVAVLGAVTEPGRYPIEPGKTRVSNLLVQAGGLAEDAQAEDAKLIRAGGEVLAVNCSAALMTRTPDADVLLEPGDLLVVGRARQEALVMGAVKTPGAVKVTQGVGIMELLILAGGPAENADLANVRIVRGPDTVLVVNAQRLLKDYELGTNTPVKPGDIVIVPEDRRQVLVFGAVESPGAYPIQDGDRLLDVLAKAGGPREEGAAASRTALIRADGTTADVYVVNLPRLLRGQQLERNYELEDDDIIVVPKDTGWSFRKFISDVYQAALMIRVFTW